MICIQRIRGSGVLIALALATSHCATPRVREQPAPVVQQAEVPPRASSMTVEELRQEIRALLDEHLRTYGPPTAPGQPPSHGNGNARGAVSRDPGAELLRQGQALVELLRDRVQADLMARLERDFGIRPALQTERVPLEAIDSRGNVVMVEVPVETRELRQLTLPSNVSRMHALVSDEDLTLALYTDVPSTIAPEEKDAFVRHYTGEEARAIAMEARLIVTLKGGAWVEAGASERVANAIAIRGLDWADGLKSNTNTRYDDTMFVILEDARGAVEAHEYRMTTESSSAEKGVGRLDSKQVTYVRGLHRGKDPGYRLKGDSADGTRVAMEGEYKIAGANIHSAYAKQTITSETPLKENVSLGCQVVAAGKSPFEKSLVFMLDAKGVKQFPYTIVGNDEMVFLDTSLREKGKRSLLVHAIARD